MPAVTSPNEYDPMSALPHMKPDAGGVIRAGVTQPGVVQVFITPQDGARTLPLTLDPEEARLLGRWLIKLGNQARGKRGQAPE